MKWLYRFFSGVVSVCGMMLVLGGAGMAATSNGCDVDGNDMINPALALCSTHVYNIRQTENPNATDKQLMNDVVALKTTVMAQQLNKQYEYLETMIRRFKVQLEKAVLTTSLQAKGASSSESSSNSFRQTDRNVYMAGVKNCNNELLPSDVMTCLNNNMNTISNISGNADNVDVAMRKQLANDFKLLNKTKVSSGGVEVVCETKSDKNKKDCLQENEIRKKSDYQECFDAMRACLRSKSYALTQAAQQQKK